MTRYIKLINDNKESKTHNLIIKIVGLKNTNNQNIENIILETIYDNFSFDEDSNGYYIFVESKKVKKSDNVITVDVSDLDQDYEEE